MHKRSDVQVRRIRVLEAGLIWAYWVRCATEVASKSPKRVQRLLNLTNHVTPLYGNGLMRAMKHLNVIKPRLSN